MFDVVDAVFDGVLGAREEADDPAERGVGADQREDEPDEEYPGGGGREVRKRMFHVKLRCSNLFCSKFCTTVSPRARNSSRCIAV